MVAKQHASSSSSLAAELLHKISLMPYKMYVAKINECDAVMPDNFKNSKWANYFTVDSSNIVKNRHANPNHVFDIFGSFSGHTGTEVCVKLLENIAADMSFYERRSAVCLQMRSMNLETWVETITNELVYCDELGLMGLCYMYNRHCVVLMQNKLWSTVQADKPLNLLDLLNICSVHLIYLGNLHFGVLTWRPCLPKKVATQSPGFNIIEEYTLDEANAAACVIQGGRKPDKETYHAGNVETTSLEHTPNTPTVVKAETATALKTDTMNSIKLASQCILAGDHETSSPIQIKETGIDTKPPMCAESVSTLTNDIVFEPPIKQPQSALHVATVNDDLSSRLNLDESPNMPKNAVHCTAVIKKEVPTKRLVTCPEDSLVLLQYPWKREFNVKLDRIQPLKIDIWSKKVSNYHVFSTSKEITPFISEVKGYGLRKRPIKVEPQVDDLNEDNTDQLIDQAQALIDTTWYDHEQTCHITGGNGEFQLA